MGAERHRDAVLKVRMPVHGHIAPGTRHPSRMRKIADGEAAARTAHSAPNGGRGVMYNVVMRDAAHLAFKSATTTPPPSPVFLEPGGGSCAQVRD